MSETLSISLTPPNLEAPRSIDWDWLYSSSLAGVFKKLLLLISELLFFEYYTGVLILLGSILLKDGTYSDIFRRLILGELVNAGDFWLLLSLFGELEFEPDLDFGPSLITGNGFTTIGGF